MYVLIFQVSLLYNPDSEDPNPMANCPAACLRALGPSDSAGGASVDTSDEALAGILPGKLRIYSPLPQECLDVMSQQGKRVIGLAGGSNSSSSPSGGRRFRLVSSLGRGSGSDAESVPGTNTETTAGDNGFGWDPVVGYPTDTCYVVQQAVLIYNDCPAVVPATSGSSSGGSGGGAATSASSGVRGTGGANSSMPWFNCSGETGPLHSEIACLLERSLLQGAINMSYVPAENDVRIMIVYEPYLGCV
jgi:hypothetical protein